MWSALRPALRPAAFALSLGVFRGASYSSTSSGVTCSRWLVRQPSPAAQRESPTPVVLLRTPGISWPGAAAASKEDTADGGSEDVWASWADMFAQRGYTTVEVDISASAPLSSSDTSDPNALSGTGADDAAISGAIKAASSALNDQIRLLAIPFAPVLIASGPGCLVAQAYVSDYPAGGLVLVSPPTDEDPRPANAKEGWKWPSFSYEPRFPICVVQGVGQDVSGSRLARAADEEGVNWRGKGVSVIQGHGVRSQKTRMDVERWMDRSGF